MILSALAPLLDRVGIEGVDFLLSSFYKINFLQWLWLNTRRRRDLSKAQLSGHIATCYCMSFLCIKIIWIPLYSWIHHCLVYSLLSYMKFGQYTWGYCRHFCYIVPLWIRHCLLRFNFFFSFFINFSYALMQRMHK